jgi:beta-galactosidase
MKRIALLATIFLVAALSTTSAQEIYDLSARRTEPARARLIPYHSMTESVKGNTSASRFVAVVEEPTCSEGGSATTFTTHFAMPVQWLNRQVILRVGYASTAYTVYVNGREIGFVPTGVMGCEFNITKASKEGRNEVSIMLDKSLLANKIYAKDEMKVEAIEVFSQPTIRMRDIGVKVSLNAQGEGIAEFAVPVKCDALNSKQTRVHYALRLADSTLLAEGYREIALDMRREDTLRFACVVPSKALWSAKHPTLLRLELESRIDNRIAECISREIGLREIKINKGKLLVNNEIVTPNLAEWEAIKDLDEAKKLGYNGIIITLDKGAESIIAECQRKGMYVVVRTPIDTTNLGDDIRRGGNPSNDPLWNESYLWRNGHAMHTVAGNCAVIGQAIAKGKTSGLNIYDTYLWLKSLAPNHMVIYEGAKGEWATDK